MDDLQCCGYNCLEKYDCLRYIETIEQRNKGKLIERCFEKEKFLDRLESAKIKNLRNLRKKHCLTLFDISLICGINESILSVYELNRNIQIQENNLNKLRKLLNFYKSLEL